MNKSRDSRAAAEINYERTQKKAKEAVAKEHETQARAADDKIARLKALRLERDNAAKVPEGKFKPAPRNKKQPVKSVSLSPDAKQQYEELAKEREQRQKTYGTHVRPDRSQVVLRRRNGSLKPG